MQATDAPLGVGEFDWAPDGATLAFTARIPDPGRYGSVEGLDASAEAPRHITGIRWHANGLGYLADRPSRLFVVAAPATDAEPFYEPAPAVVPEGVTPRRRSSSPTRRPSSARAVRHARARCSRETRS